MNNITSSIVGPICESSDVFVKKAQIHTQSQDILAILDAGAYGFSMSSNYNTRPKPPELLIDQGVVKQIRARESLEDLYHLEIID